MAHLVVAQSAPGRRIEVVLDDLASEARMERLPEVRPFRELCRATGRDGVTIIRDHRRIREISPLGREIDDLGIE